MRRPPSIKLFERLWWASTVLWGIGTWLGWRRTENALYADPRTAPVAGWAQWLNVGIVLLLTLVVWWLVARRASRVGKWIVVGLAAVSGVRTLILVLGLLTSRTFHPLSQGSFFLAAALTIASAVLLFRDDARPWFGEYDADEGEPA